MTGNTLEKAAPNLSGNPQLIDPATTASFLFEEKDSFVFFINKKKRGVPTFIATNFIIPSIVKCSLFFTTKKASFIKE